MGASMTVRSEIDILPKWLRKNPQPTLTDEAKSNQASKRQGYVQSTSLTLKEVQEESCGGLFKQPKFGSEG